MNLKDLNPDSSPQAAFGARLRRVREERGWTQEEFGEKVGYSGTHMSAIETGRKPPTLRFSRSLDRFLGGDAYEREWREMRNGSLLEGFPEYVNYEGRAAEIRLYEVGVVPGLLQTPEYATALAAGAVKRGAITPQEAEEFVRLAAERQAALIRTPAPLLFATLDESCIRCPVGGPSVMNAQFDRLIEFADQPNTVLQIAPFTMGEHRAFTLPITVLTMTDRSLMSYAESSQRGHLERETAFVLPILTAYHQLQAEALTQASSVTMIRQLRKGSP
ncbi:helix-turn-helix domain-containing protein [Streptomyces buecherae]|uniref:Helix-turn-helix domain-containing protein n=1 Tax=Streptomyces buecherae TaxID=2763006 RepID=A0A7H8N3X6_9ACTN|nr:helix-turn-helix transcriptional regulator [Streptomyces buecherae]QKW49122.1 helix-turn-helix domain-containing protein [Streptomyces buecherae]